MSDLKQRILDLSSRPTGMAAKDIGDYRTTYVRDLANELVAEGKLHKAKLGAKHVRFYIDRHLAMAAQRKAEAKAAAETQAQATRRTSAGWAPNAKVVINKKTKFTKCPSPPQRFAAIDTPNIFGGNQRGRVSD